MARIDNLKHGGSSMPHQVRRLNASAPIGYSSVSDGALEILSDEGLIVKGSAYVSGLFRGDGTFDWSGPMKFAGDVSVTKTLDVTAAARFRDDVSIEKKLDVTAETRLRAKTTLENDLVVQTPGKIDAGGIVIERTGAAGGTINFVPNGSISVGLGIMQFVPPDMTAGFSIGGGKLDIRGGLAVGTSAAPGNADVAGRITARTLTVSNLPTISGRTPNLWADPATGQLYRII